MLSWRHFTPVVAALSGLMVIRGGEGCHQFCFMIHRHGMLLAWKGNSMRRNWPLPGSASSVYHMLPFPRITTHLSSE